jgi:mannose-6-phosphate isomerase-like protein (cupin superfamily)
VANPIDQNELPFSGSSYAFIGRDHGDVGISFFLVDTEPGNGPALHRHQYAEVFIVQDGKASFTVGDETVEATGGQIVVVHAGQPHRFVNSGDGQLRLTAIHGNDHFVTEWLAAENGPNPWKS